MVEVRRHLSFYIAGRMHLASQIIVLAPFLGMVKNSRGIQAKACIFKMRVPFLCVSEMENCWSMKQYISPVSL